jgi:hypothetical protein
MVRRGFWMTMIAFLGGCSSREPALEDLGPRPSFDAAVVADAVSDAPLDAPCDPNHESCPCVGQAPSCPWWAGLPDASACTLDAVEAVPCPNCRLERCQNLVVLSSTGVDSFGAWAFDGATGVLVADWGKGLTLTDCEGPAGFDPAMLGSCVPMALGDAGFDADAEGDGSPE